MFHNKTISFGLSCFLISCSATQDSTVKIQEPTQVQSIQKEIEHQPLLKTSGDPSVLFESEQNNEVQAYQVKVENYRQQILDSKPIPPKLWLELYQQRSNLVRDLKPNLGALQKEYYRAQRIIDFKHLVSKLGDSHWRAQLLKLNQSQDPFLESFLMAMSPDVDIQYFQNLAQSQDSILAKKTLNTLDNYLLANNPTIEMVEDWLIRDSIANHKNTYKPHFSIQLKSLLMDKDTVRANHVMKAIMNRGSVHFNYKDSWKIPEEIINRIDSLNKTMIDMPFSQWVKENKAKHKGDDQEIIKGSFAEIIAMLDSGKAISEIQFPDSLLLELEGWELIRALKWTELVEGTFKKELVLEQLKLKKNRSSYLSYLVQEKKWEDLEKLLFSISKEERTAMDLLIVLYLKTTQYQKLELVLNNHDKFRFNQLGSYIKNSSHFNTYPDWAQYLKYKGDSQGAKSIIKNHLWNNEADDSAYEVALEILSADEFRNFVDQLASNFSFEERPILWKGILFKSQGKWSEAKELFEKARAIDPSDGGQEPGRRMRVYEELALADSALGNLEASKTWKQVVQAIRQGEEADKYYKLDLTTQALALYKNALTQFEDAYCIQSRLAVQLDKVGDSEQALVHYKKAFELMPSSFGRMESHCFSCDGIFKTELGRKTAKEVFNQPMIQSVEHSAKVHYLKGLIALEEEKTEDAIEFFKNAIQQDPQYISAYKKLFNHIDDPLEKLKLSQKMMSLGLYTRGMYTTWKQQNRPGVLFDELNKRPTSPKIIVSDYQLKTQDKDTDDENNQFPRSRFTIFTHPLMAIYYDILRYNETPVENRRYLY